MTIAPGPRARSARVGEDCADIARDKIRAVKKRAALAKRGEAVCRRHWQTLAMQEELVCALDARRPEIRGRWRALLRAERATSPLAHPDALVHLVDWTIDEVLGALRASRRSTTPSPARSKAEALRADCACGRNPFLAFFLAGEQAMLEALVLTQAAQPALDPAARDTAVAELWLVLRLVRTREVQAFCSLCQHRPGAATTRPAQETAACNRSR